MNTIKTGILSVFAALLLVACGNAESSETKSEATTSKEVNVYTHRHYDADKQLFKQFEEKTGIKVNVVSAKADELIKRLEIEKDQSPADVLITVDAGRLQRAKEKQLLQAVELPNVKVGEQFKDSENFWYALTQRGRILVYSKERVQPEELSSYEALTEEQWKGRILVRSSSNLYNQSLLASMVSHHGIEKASEWAKGIVANMAREPKGNDRDQVKAIAAGIGDVAIVNTYYIGKLLNSKDAEEVKAGEHVGVFFPNQKGRGAHMNVSGAGVAAHSPNKENAIAFIEYLLSEEAQSVFAEANYEFPVNPKVQASELLRSWGEFKGDTLAFEQLGLLNKDAVLAFDKAGWK